jgi:hypothetical protein
VKTAPETVFSHFEPALHFEGYDLPGYERLPRNSSIQKGASNVTTRKEQAA